MTVRLTDRRGEPPHYARVDRQKLTVLEVGYEAGTAWVYADENPSLN